MTINDHIVKLDHSAMYTAYATLAAYTTCNILGVEDEIQAVMALGIPSFVYTSYTER